MSADIIAREGSTTTTGNLNERLLKRLLDGIREKCRYLDRLTGRMSQLHFPRDDALLKKAESARLAMYEVRAEVERLAAF